MAELLRVPIDQLQVGLYIHLELKWFQHPFAFGQFKIKSEDQLQTLRGLGLTSVLVDAAMSDGPVPQPGAARAPAPPTQPPPAKPAESPMLLAKRAMMDRIRQQREEAARIERAFTETAQAVREIDKNLFSRPAETVNIANQLVGQIADSILAAPELAIHVMGDKLGGEEIYMHSLNVTILSMMIARDIKLPHELAKALGMGALFHDVGNKNIPDRVLGKIDPYNHAEQSLIETHCAMGVEIGRKLGLPAPALAIVQDHHELFDGSGYPRGLKGEEAGVLSRIVVIANYFDELCNPRNPAAALTPHAALSLMFAKMRSRFDAKLLQVFIRALGVYPPGTIVQLSNGLLGMVVTVNTDKPTKPIIVVYEAGVPKEEAVMVDMERETDLNIVRSISPTQVPKEVYQYLSPRAHVSYFFDARQPGQARSAA
jgi:putative nucleotidyltransferase with HDIG domain